MCMCVGGQCLWVIFGSSRSWEELWVSFGEKNGEAWMVWSQEVTIAH